MNQNTKDIGIRKLLTVIWLSQLSFYSYHILTAHTDESSVLKTSAIADGIKEVDSSCGLCSHFIAKAADISFFTIAIFIFTLFFSIIFLKENNLPFLITSRNFQRGPPL